MTGQAFGSSAADGNLSSPPYASLCVLVGLFELGLRRAHDAGIPVVAIAETLGVSHQCVSAILRR